jgi:urease accessory protein
MSTAPIILTQKLKTPPEKIDFSLPLTAEQRQKTRQRIEHDDGQVLQTIHFQLPRGTHIHPQNYFQNDAQTITIQVIAKAETVITVRSPEPLQLLKAAYHLGNRHVPLEVQTEYLRFAPDHVLEEMLQKLGVLTLEEEVPFFPEEGAYGGHHHG